MTSAPLSAASRTRSLTRAMFFVASSLSAHCRTPSTILRGVPLLPMRFSLRRLLLGDAVEGAAARQDMARRKSHDSPARKERLQRLRGGPRRTRTIGGHDHRRIADEEVHVACGNDLAFLIFHAAGRGNANNLQNAAARVA